MKNGVKNTADVFAVFLKHELSKKFMVEVPKVKTLITESYENSLAVPFGRGSKVDPIMLLDSFSERLRAFNYVSVAFDGVTFEVPSMETFDFSGELRIIEFILEGVAGVFVEMTEEDVLYFSSKKDLDVCILEFESSTGEPVFLVEPDNALRNIIRNVENKYNKKYNVFPFSNTPPINIFVEADDYVKNNLSSWIAVATGLAAGRLKEYFSGGDTR